MKIKSSFFKAPFHLLLSLCLLSCNSEVEVDTPPNVIYILADDMGLGDVSIYNPEGKIKTPHLDAMAKAGMRFTDAHTTSSVCTPTRYGIITGRYNWRTFLKQGVLTGKSPAMIPESRTTVASLMKKNGYQTAFIGKWHLGWDWTWKTDVEDTGTGWGPNDFEAIDFAGPVTNTPNDLGFDYAYGHPASLDIAPYVYVENGQVTGLPDKVTIDTGEYSWWRNGPTGSDFVHEEVTPSFFQRSNAFIKEQAEKGQAYFLYLALPSPHTPILPTGEWDGKSNFLPYADFVMQIDHYIGELLKVIEDSGQADNTLVIFTTDNGCSPAAGYDRMVEMGHFPNLHYRGHKADIYDGGHRVPFIAKWPKQIEAGQVSDQLICTTDLMATLADILDYDLQANEGEDSFSMLPTLKQDEAQSEGRSALVHHSVNGSFAIREGDWKLILVPGSGGWSYPSPGRDQAILDTLPPVQLYNMKDDPGESSNLQGQYPEKVLQLQQLLADYIQKGRSTPGPSQSNDDFTGEWQQIAWMEELK